MRLSTTGTAVNFGRAIVGRIALKSIGPSERHEWIRLTREFPIDDTNGYKAILTSSEVHSSQVPIVHSVRDIDHLRTGDIVVLEPRSGFIRTLYRPDSLNNTLFMTERCNSNCLMCSQPPEDRDDTESLTERNLQVIRLISSPPAQLGITGGEPTLLRERLFLIVERLKEKFPSTHVHMLTNGRMFAMPEFTARFAQIQHPDLTLGIPVYSDFARDHDYVVQARGAFDQTIMGLHQLARWGQRVEIRIVLHAQTIQRLVQLSEFIYRNLLFAEHVTFMGLENIGHVRQNLSVVWVDPRDYQEQLEQAVEFLAVRGMNVSIYNHQLCVLKPSLWKFAKKSISDWKNIYLEECEQCAVLDRCGGLFKWADKLHSKYIHPISATPN